MSDQRVQGLLFASVTAILWGFLAVALKFALQFLDVLTIVALRFQIAVILLMLIYLVKSPRELQILKRPPLLAILAGLFLAANYYCYFYGLSLTSASNTQIIIQTGPMLLAFIGVVYFKETLNLIQKIGFLVVLIGGAFFYSDQLTDLTHSAEQYFIGNLWIFVAALTWAFWGMIQKILGQKWKPQQINMIVYLVGALVFIPYMNWEAVSELSVAGLCLMLFLGINTLFAYGAMSEALKRAPANQVSMIITLNPLLTLTIMATLDFFAVTWVETEVLNPLGYIGAVIFVLGVAMVTGVFKKRGASRV